MHLNQDTRIFLYRKIPTYRNIPIKGHPSTALNGQSRKGSSLKLGDDCIPPLLHAVPPALTKSSMLPRTNEEALQAIAVPRAACAHCRLGVRSPNHCHTLWTRIAGRRSPSDCSAKISTSVNLTRQCVWSSGAETTTHRHCENMRVRTDTVPVIREDSNICRVAPKAFGRVSHSHITCERTALVCPPPSPLLQRVHRKRHHYAGK